MKKIKFILMLLLIGAGITLWPAHSKAATGAIYLSPSSKSVSKGSSFSLAFRINPGTPVDTAEADINYDTGKLQATSVSCSTAVFNLTVRCSIAGGQVQITEGKIGGTVNSDTLMATINFKALAGSGSTSLTLSGANAAYSGSYTNPSPSGATVSFSTPTTSTSKKTTTSNSTTSSGSSSTTNNTPKTVVKVNATTTITKVQYTDATVNVKTNVPAQISIHYGLDKSKLDKTTDYSKLGTDNTITFGNSQLEPGTTYFYQVFTKDSDGNTGSNTADSFKTKGYSISLTVLDSNYNPVANQKVTLHSDPMIANTDSKGVVSFDNVVPGIHKLEYSNGGKNYQQSIYVQNNVTSKDGVETASSQTMAVILPNLMLAKKQAYNYASVISMSIAAILFILLLIDISPLGPHVRYRISKFVHTVGGQKHLVNNNIVKPPSKI